MITIIAKFNVLNGSVDEFKKCAVNVVRDTRKEKGNLAYKIYQSREDATKFTFIEEWLNDTAIEQHNNAKHFLQFLEDIKPLTDGDVQSTVCILLIEGFMDIYDNNINVLTNYIADGSKGCNSNAVGVELEHFVIDKNGDCVPYINGVENIIEQLAQNFPKHVYSEGFLIGLSCDKYNITLEPGAQIEISIKPTENICEIENIYGEFLSVINPILDKYSYRLTTLGYMPKNKAKDISLIPKKRYEYMNKYFKSVGTRGINMMRGTASAQVSIDFADEKDCVQKFKKANIISPILSLICDNAPVFEGKPFWGNTLRTYIWNDVDNDRCGIVPTVLDSDFSFKKYAEYIYNSPAILTVNGDDIEFTADKKICDIYKDTPIDESIAEHLLSMFFPDVRLKKYIEIRPADSMPIKYVLAYAALIKGIFMSDFSIDASLNDITQAKNNIILKGYNAEVYGTDAHTLAMKLCSAAYNALDSSDREYLLPLKQLIDNKQTLKETINLAKGRGIL